MWRLITTLGAGLLWHGGWVSKRTHMAVRSAAMTSLLRWRGLRLGSEKSTISAAQAGRRSHQAQL